MAQGWGKVANDFLGQIALGLIGVGVAACAVVGGIIWGVSAVASAGESTIGVRLTAQQTKMRQNGTLCEAFIDQALAQSKRQNKIVELKLPENAAQNCPKL